MDKDTQYWKDRSKALEVRMDQLEKEIHRLKGHKPLSKEFIEEHNKRIRDRVRLCF